MKILVVSDIHGDYLCCQKALAAFDFLSADYLVLLGDLLYHGPRNPLPEGYDPAKVYQLLNKYKDKIIAVRGNCDSEVDQMVLDFNISDDFTFLSLKNRLVYLTHGHVYGPDKLPPGLTKNDVLLFGHIHEPIAERAADYFLGNPGSCSLPKPGYPMSYGLLTDTDFSVYDLDGKLILLQAFD